MVITVLKGAGNEIYQEGITPLYVPQFKKRFQHEEVLKANIVLKSIFISRSVQRERAVR